MATRKNFKKTGKKRIKPKGGAKKRKTVRGGVWPFFKKKWEKVNPDTPIDGGYNWFSILQHLEIYIKKDDLATNEKYQKYINEFKNNVSFREYIFTYIHTLDRPNFEDKLFFITSRGLITDQESDEQQSKYNRAHPK
jgi:hypothetical protein